MEGRSLNAILRLLIEKELIHRSEIKEHTQAGGVSVWPATTQMREGPEGQCGKQEGQSLTAEAGQWQKAGPGSEVHRKKQALPLVARTDLNSEAG